MINEATMAAALTLRLRRMFYLGIALGLMLGFWTTVIGMGAVWAVWHWWLA